MALKKSSIVVNDVLEELNEENKRLLNELLFADKCLNALIEFKSFVDLVFNEFKHNLNENQLKRYQELNENIEIILRDELNITSKRNVLDFRRSIQSIDNIYGNLSPKEEINDKEDNNYEEEETEEEIDLSKTEDNQTSDDLDYHKLKTLVSKSSKKIKKYYKKSDRKNPKLSIHFKEQEFLCKRCQFRTNKESLLRVHTHSVHSSQIVFTQKQNISDHLKSNSKKSVIIKNIVCTEPDCQFRTNKCSSLRRHMISHSKERPFSCTVDGCDKRYKSKIHRDRHIKSHSTERPFECTHEGCHKRFKTIADRNTHQICHSEKNLRCDWPGCDYTTTRKCNLRCHGLTHSQDYKFLCEWPGCDKRYKSNKELSLHMMIHRNDKRHVCHWPGCSYRTTNSFLLKKHMNFHTNVYPFMCDFPECGKRLKTKASLVIHTRTHTNEKPFVCQFPNCRYRTIAAGTLKTHEKRFHRK